MLPPDEGEGVLGPPRQVRGEVPPVYVQVLDRGDLGLHLPVREDEAQGERPHERLRGEHRQQQDRPAQRQGHGSPHVVLREARAQAQGHLPEEAGEPVRALGDEAAVAVAADLGVRQAQASHEQEVCGCPLLHGVEGPRRDEHAVPREHHVVLRPPQAGRPQRPARGAHGSFQAAHQRVQLSEHLEHHGVLRQARESRGRGPPLPGRASLLPEHGQVLQPGHVQRVVVFHQAQPQAEPGLLGVVPEALWGLDPQGFPSEHRQRGVELRSDQVHPLRVTHAKFVRQGGQQVGHLQRAGRGHPPVGLRQAQVPDPDGAGVQVPDFLLGQAEEVLLA
mmetsp:Transcript_6504/g.19238  ORF Transcript_6504/g.19238 Transcript_6504/m.19238 type:complete len:334 (+) Transcript_6504:974-1975(+)